MTGLLSTAACLNLNLFTVNFTNIFEKLITFLRSCLCGCAVAHLTNSFVGLAFLLALYFYPFFSTMEKNLLQVKSSEKVISFCQSQLAELVYHLFVQAPVKHRQRWKGLCNGEWLRGNSCSHGILQSCKFICPISLDAKFPKIRQAKQ